MHAWCGVLGLLLGGACGGDDAVSEVGGGGGTGGGAESTSGEPGEPDSGSTGGEPMADPIDHDNCGGLANHPTEVEDPNTDHFTDLLQGAIDDSGYGANVRIDRSLTVEGSDNLRFCADLVLRVGWFAVDDYQCWDHGTDEAITAEFASSIALWPELPLSVVPLQDVEATAAECNAELVHPYEPCNSGDGFVLTMWYGSADWVDDCHQQFEDAVVDLVTGELLRCESELGPDNCDDDG